MAHLLKHAKLFSVILTVLTGTVLLVPSASADDWWRNKFVKQAAIGAGIGAAASALSNESSVLKGVGVGALAGVGTAAVDKTDALNDNPMVRSTLKGAIIGTGASAVTDRSKLKGAVVGAGAGAGFHLIRDYWNRRY